MFKGSLLLPDPCTTPLPAKLHALTHSPSVLANRERLWTFDLDKSQVRGRYNYIRDIRRSHCQPFYACVLLSGSEHMLAPCWSRENYLVKIFCLLCVCFQHWRAINSNSMNLDNCLQLYLIPPPPDTHIRTSTITNVVFNAPSLCFWWMLSFPIMHLLYSTLFFICIFQHRG
jgi:hypothetical protein